MAEIDHLYARWAAPRCGPTASKRGSSEQRPQDRMLFDS